MISFLIVSTIPFAPGTGRPSNTLLRTTRVPFRTFFAVCWAVSVFEDDAARPLESRVWGEMVGASRCSPSTPAGDAATLSISTDRKAVGVSIALLTVSELSIGASDCKEETDTMSLLVVTRDWVGKEDDRTPIGAPRVVCASWGTRPRGSCDFPLTRL